MKRLCFIMCIVLVVTTCQEGEEQEPQLPLDQLLLGSIGSLLMDVHGAGAQRSDPKSGDVSAYSEGHGPQGDVVRIFNFARCVRGSSQNTNNYPVIDTAQSNCYDDGSNGQISCPSSGQDYYGQDNQYSNLSQSYTDNGDDTVTDNNSGLMWQKAFSKVDWNDAQALATTTSTGGHTDWRVPTIKELYSLMNFDGATGSAGPETTSAPADAIPYLNTTVFDFEYPATGRYIDAQYITATVYVSTVMGGEQAFFGVNFADGRIKGYPQAGKPDNSNYYIRLVRANTNYGRNTLVDNADDTITDSDTGLIWMKKDSGNSAYNANISSYSKQDGSMDWSESLDFCESLSLGGQTDWRLPDAKELQSIVDYTRSPDTSSSAAIDSSFQTTTIANEGGAIDYPFYWSSTTHLDGPITGEFAIYISFGRALGFMRPPGPGGPGL